MQRAQHMCMLGPLLLQHKQQKRSTEIPSLLLTTYSIRGWEHSSSVLLSASPSPLCHQLLPLGAKEEENLGPLPGSPACPQTSNRNQDLRPTSQLSTQQLYQQNTVFFKVTKKGHMGGMERKRQQCIHVQCNQQTVLYIFQEVDFFIFIFVSHSLTVLSKPNLSSCTDSHSLPVQQTL